ncbi:MAG: exodeoxyribonuclease III [Clostridia bacterium]|nr:exodeoxyribonuclease III [Clostridia bacterium]
MKLVSFNVNGLRAVLNKGFAEHFDAFGADVVCLQEIKALEGQAEFHPEGYVEIYNSAEKKGYSGTLTLTRVRPLSIAFGIGGKHTDEGRVITAEYEHFYLVNCYSPNAQDGLRRIAYRLEFERDLADYLAALDSKKPVVLCGDLNVAHEEIDLARPAQNRGNPGFSDEERGAFSALLSRGFLDSFRALHPTRRDAYSWWSFRARARENNVGWRIDYFVISERLLDFVTEAEILPDVTGSDHCPVTLTLDFDK